MPSRRKTNRRKMNPRFYVYCEGEKTEPNYFNALIRDRGWHRNRLIDVEVVDTEKNTARELVIKASEADRLRDRDQVWVVFDKDGYTKHAEAFAKAERESVCVAFSSISFETWILLHQTYTTKAFDKSDDLIGHLNKKLKFDYEKNDDSVYERIKDKTADAIKHAKRLRKAVKSGARPKTPVHELNPYTDVDLLLEALDAFAEKWCRCP